MRKHKNKIVFIMLFCFIVLWGCRYAVLNDGFQLKHQLEHQYYELGKIAPMEDNMCLGKQYYKDLAISVDAFEIVAADEYISRLGKTEEDYYRAIASSFMLSADNAHAVHPNHPEKTDVANCVYMNEGIVIKSHAGQRYTSNGISIAVFKKICEEASVPVQFFANRSDAVGGGTLGNIAMAQVSMNSVDIGIPQLAMHSAYETAGIKDTYYMVEAMKAFYNAHISETKTDTLEVL